MGLVNCLNVLTVTSQVLPLITCTAVPLLSTVQPIFCYLDSDTDMPKSFLPLHTPAFSMT